MDHVAVSADVAVKSEVIEEDHPAVPANADGEIERPSNRRLVVILGSLWVRDSLNLLSLDTSYVLTASSGCRWEFFSLL